MRCMCIVLIKKKRREAWAMNQIPEVPKQCVLENPLLEASKGTWRNLWETDESLKKAGLMSDSMNGPGGYYAE